MFTVFGKRFVGGITIDTQDQCADPMQVFFNDTRRTAGIQYIHDRLFRDKDPHGPTVAFLAVNQFKDQPTSLIRMEVSFRLILFDDRL